MDWNAHVSQLVDLRMKQWLTAMVASGALPASVLGLNLPPITRRVEEAELVGEKK
jgi:shikimate kinase